MTIQEQVVNLMNAGEFNKHSLYDSEGKFKVYSKKDILESLEKVDTTDPTTGKEFLKKFKELKKRIQNSKDPTHTTAFSKVFDFYLLCKNDLRSKNII